MDTSPSLLQSVQTLSYACVALGVIAAALAVAVAFSLIVTRRLSKRYEAFMLRESNAGIPIEALLDECLAETRAVGRGAASLKSRLDDLENRLAGCFQKIGVVRYNPFNDTGGDLSYVIALLDESNTGFVLNGIYNRSGSYTYAKEIKNGVPVKHKLSAEELQALQMAADGGRAERQ